MSIKQNAKAEIIDILNGKLLGLEVNFDDSLKDCVKLTLDNKDFIAKYSDLFSFMFLISTKEQQAKMMPVKEELGNQYMKQIHVRLKKDMKEGEEMIVNVPINVPELIEADIRHELSKKDLTLEASNI